MKVTIIGGGGLVGSSAAFALQCGGLVREIVLVDVNRERAAGEALDLLHGSSLAADQRIRAGGYEEIPSTDLVLITAGLRRKPDESRLDLINRNVELFRGILGEVRAAGLKADAVVLVVSNPVDVLTYLAVQELDAPPERILGLGTQLDSVRFRSLLADRLGVPPTQVSALMLGEHGDSMVPIWSAAQVGGLPLEKWPGWTPAMAKEVEKRTRGSGAEVIRLKGGAGFAVGLAIRDVVHSNARDAHRVLPVSSLQSGAYGLRDVCLSVPTVVGRRGVVRHVELELWPKEQMALQASGRVLRETIGKVLGAGGARRVAGMGHAVSRAPANYRR
ncbi:MAG: lactate/malate dehydrogenase family protein [Pirellulales bacterium]